MSHEIRTPLGAILGFSQLMDEAPVPVADQGRYLAIIRRNGERLRELVDGILDLSKIEAGHMDVDETLFSVPELVTDLAALLGHQARSKGLALQFTYSRPLPRCLRTDAGKLRQILVNLVGNAVKFTDQGGVYIHFRATDKVECGVTGHYAITVSDTGPGIPDDRREFLFRPFSQADRTVHRRYGGTGLGLSLSRRFARLLGGDIVLLPTEPGCGASFEFSFESSPLTPGEFELLSQEEPVFADTLSDGGCIEILSEVKSDASLIPSPRRESPPRLDGVFVLFVDDAPDNRILVKRLLTLAGAKVECACDGREGVELALRNDHDIILMDLQMPILDGFEATRILRSHGFDRPIIALSAHAFSEERAQSLGAGCNDHLTKPIDRNLLVEHVARYTGRTSSPGGKRGHDGHPDSYHSPRRG